MSPFRKLLFVGVGVFALHGVQACATDTELNPQPLPPNAPGEPSKTDDKKESSDSREDPANAGPGGGSSATPSADGGTDAADGGPG